MYVQNRAGVLEETIENPKKMDYGFVHCPRCTHRCGMGCEPFKHRWVSYARNNHVA